MAVPAVCLLRHRPPVEATSLRPPRPTQQPSACPAKQLRPPDRPPARPNNRPTAQRRTTDRATGRPSDERARPVSTDDAPLEWESPQRGHGGRQPPPGGHTAYTRLTADQRRAATDRRIGAWQQDAGQGPSRGSVSTVSDDEQRTRASLELGSFALGSLELLGSCELGSCELGRCELGRCELGRCELGAVS